MEEPPLPIMAMLSGLVKPDKRIPKYSNGWAYCRNCEMVVRPVGRFCPMCGKNVRFKPKHHSSRRAKRRVDPNKYLDGWEVP